MVEVECQVHETIYNPEIGPNPPRVPLAHELEPIDGVPGIGVPISCGAVSFRGISVFVPDSLKL